MQFRLVLLVHIYMSRWHLVLILHLLSILCRPGLLWSIHMHLYHIPQSTIHHWLQSRFLLGGVAEVSLWSGYYHSVGQTRQLLELLWWWRRTWWLVRGLRVRSCGRYWSMSESMLFVIHGRWHVKSYRGLGDRQGGIVYDRSVWYHWRGDVFSICFPRFVWIRTLYYLL